jgi:hypothetical protein
VIAGVQPAVADAAVLVADTSHHLRALLRDVLCGHLDPDLVAVADGILDDAVAGEPHEVAPEPPEPELSEPAEPEPLEPAMAEPPETVFFDELEF